MDALIFIAVAVTAYFIAGLNPAIVLSKAIYHKDIRDEGSHNPGFTNFARVFGKKYAWLVFVLDIGKGAVISVIAGLLFAAAGYGRQTGVAFAGMFAMLGNAFPVMYHFHGGKGFLICLSTLWFIHPAAGGIATLVLVVLLLIFQYMSLATMSAMLVGAIFVVIFGAELPVCLMYSACVVFMIVRHRGNIVRLLHGEESRFRLRRG